MLSVRLDKKIVKDLERLARIGGLTKSDLIRRCLSEYVARFQGSTSAWELGKDLFGKYSSGRSGLSSRRKLILREKIHAKKGRGRLRPPGRAVRSS